MHILVVDDDIPTVEVIRTSLHWDLLGIDRVETAYDYTEAQNKICASQPDIILCDIEMPRGSGLDLLRWLREEKRDCEFVTMPKPRCNTVLPITSLSHSTLPKLKQR